MSFTTACGSTKNDNNSSTDNSHSHNYSSTYVYDSESHWKECSCGDKKDIGKHNIFDEVYTVCNYYENSQGLRFNLLSNDTYEVYIIGTYEDTNLVIPCEYNGKTVTSIGDQAFYICKILKNIYYKGTSSEWNYISIGSWNSNLTNANRYYYSETEPNDTTNKYWHYNDNNEIVGMVIYYI